jgi:hypothetical protein
MMILASLSSGMPAAVDLSKLLSLGRLPDPLHWSLDAWQSKVVYLLGSVQNFWAKTRHQQDLGGVQELMAEWKSINDELLCHQTRAPAVCQALSITPANEDTPFEAVRYINGPVSAAWQMLHTAYLVLTISQPALQSGRLTVLSSPEVTEKALLYAKRIVSNSIANRCTIAWANAVQLLTVAGQCLVEAKEQQACQRALNDIQHHTGWDTRANMERLSTAWRRVATNRGTTRSITGTESGDSTVGLMLYNVWRGDEDDM